jgi:glutathione synthase/RimK-type ligase-like ATP-grasp enzyme
VTTRRIEPPTVLALTDEPDPTFDAVSHAIAERGVRVAVASPSALASGSAGITAQLSEIGSEDSGRLVVDGGDSVDVGDVRCVWNRRSRAPASRIADEARRRFVETEFRLALDGLAHIAPIRWVNHPRATRWLERNKLAQLQIAREAALTVPPTLYSSVADDVIAFAARYETVAVKSGAGWFRELAEGFEFAYTQRMDAAELERCRSNIAAAPILVQPYVEKRYELRVTVVGEAVFACRIDSQSSDRTRVDWRRYDFDLVQHELVELASDTRLAVHRFMDRAGLQFAAIDMICAEDGSIVFLEANPDGQFLWIEELTGAPIVDALVDLLTRDV